MNQIISTARALFVVTTIFLIGAALYVVLNRAHVSGGNALVVLGAAIASIGAIASWNPRKD